MRSREGPVILDLRRSARAVWFVARWCWFAWSWRGAEDVEVVAGGGPVPGVPVVEVRLLGPVQAMRAGRGVPLGGPRQRAVLALLVLEAGRVGPAG